MCLRSRSAGLLPAARVLTWKQRRKQRKQRCQQRKQRRKRQQQQRKRRCQQRKQRKRTCQQRKQQRRQRKQRWQRHPSCRKQPEQQQRSRKPERETFSFSKFLTGGEKQFPETVFCIEPKTRRKGLELFPSLPIVGTNQQKLTKADNAPAFFSEIYSVVSGNCCHLGTPILSQAASMGSSQPSSIQACSSSRAPLLARRTCTAGKLRASARTRMSSASIPAAR